MQKGGQPREKQLNDLLSHHMVDIYVGPENTHWILHEKLLCAKSAFFAQIFYGKNPHGSTTGNKTFGLPDEEDAPFKLFVGWLYSGRVPVPEEEKDLGDLFELYLMGEKWQIAGLVKDVLAAVRKFYRVTQTYPGLRRVQYIYANTDEGSSMRQLLTSSVARMLVLEEKDGSTMPAHWEKALMKNGQLALDLLRAVRLWRLDPADVPDAREEPQELEKQKVKQVEEAEEERKQDVGLAGSNGNRDASVDKTVAAGKDLERLTNGAGKMSAVLEGQQDR